MRFVQWAGLTATTADTTSSIVSMLQSSSPPSRTVVGMDAQIIKASLAVLPDTIQDLVQVFITM